MTLSTNARIFLAALGFGAVFVAGAFAIAAREPGAPLALHPLVQDIAITEQLHPDAMRRIAAQGYATVIDMRPDGEAPNEPPASAMANAAGASHLRFAYVPVPHGDIPDTVVASLRAALLANPGPVLLYCRSGRRAARSWSLVEASRPGGLDVDAILAAVKSAGQSADDLHDAIARRVQARTAAAPRTAP